MSSALMVPLAVGLLVPSLAGARLAVRGPIAVAAAVPTTNWLDFTLIAENRIVTGPNLNLSGNFATWGAGGTLELGQNCFQLDDTPPPFVAADTLNLAGQASVANAFTNQITGNPTGEVRGTTQAESFPLALSLPTFPTAAVCNNCALNSSDVVVQPDDTITLSPGCYGELFARQNAAVFLQPGAYTFKEWDIQKFASVTANGPVQIHIRKKIDTEEGNFLGAASGDALDFQVWIGARTACQAGATTHSAIGKFSIAIGTFVAPTDDDFNFNKGVILMGTAVADQIDVRGQHEDRPPTPTPNLPTPTPQTTSTPHIDTTPTPTPAVTPTPNLPTPTPQTTSTPHIDTTPTPTPNGSPTPRPSNTPRKLPTPTPTQPFTPPTPTPIPSIIPPPTPTPTVAPRKHPWGKRSGLIDSLFPARTGSRIAPSMKRPLGVRR